jgi:hypothetical protein
MLQLYLWHDLHATVFKIKRELYIASGSAPTKGNFWVRAYFIFTRQIEQKVLT